MEAPQLLETIVKSPQGIVRSLHRLLRSPPRAEVVPGSSRGRKGCYPGFGPNNLGTTNAKEATTTPPMSSSASLVLKHDFVSPQL